MSPFLMTKLRIIIVLPNVKNEQHGARTALWGKVFRSTIVYLKRFTLLLTSFSFYGCVYPLFAFLFHLVYGVRHILHYPLQHFQLPHAQRLGGALQPEVIVDDLFQFLEEGESAITFLKDYNFLLFINTVNSKKLQR